MPIPSGVASVHSLPCDDWTTSRARTSAGRARDPVADRTPLARERPPGIDVVVHHHDAIVLDEIDEPRLGGEVLLHRAVVVQVVAREVGEGRRREAHPLHALLLQRMRRHLHRDRAHPGIDQLAQHALQLHGTGRGESGPPGSVRPALPTSTPSVPIDAAGASGVSSTWRSIDAVVVLPLVPVTPTIDSARAGKSWKAAAAIAAARRPSRTTTAGIVRRRIVLHDGHRRRRLPLLHRDSHVRRATCRARR